MANEAGGNDNITVVVLDVVVGEPPGPRAADTTTDGAKGAGATGVAGVVGAGAASAMGDLPSTSGASADRALAGTTMVVSPPLGAPSTAGDQTVYAPGAGSASQATAIAVVPDTQAPPAVERAKKATRSGYETPTRVSTSPGASPSGSSSSWSCSAALVYAGYQ